MEEKPPTPAGEVKPTAPAKKIPTPVFQEFKDPALLEFLTARLPEAVVSTHSYLGQNFVVTAPGHLLALMTLLRTDASRLYTLLEDATAIDYPDRAKRFELVYVLFSITAGDRLIVKLQVADGESVPSLAASWKSADWAEREIYDMFGISFEGHPDLKRILLPDGWKGHPLRKEYDIEKQDEEWIAANMKLRAPQSLLGIPSYKEIEHMKK